MYSSLANVRATRETLERHGLATKHHLGQNFLVSDAVVGKIMGLAELDARDTVLEVGPGIGTLTCALLESGAGVEAIEADRSLAPVLAETCPGERLTLVWGDALKADFAALDPAPNKFVANLPYQVAATLVLRVLEELPNVERLVVMVQKEVADRIAATPGSRTYGAYTAKLGLYAQVTGRFEVAPGNFFPPPHVDSAVVRIERAPLADPVTSLPLSDAQLSAATRAIDAAFAQRRKTIRNSMAASGYERDALDAAFAATGIAATCRAETLAPEDFVRLARALESGAA